MQPTINITRENGRLVGVKATIPVWQSISNDGFIKVRIPLLGEIETYAKDESDIDTAVSEAIHCFIQVSQALGKGLEADLIDLGWTNTAENILSLPPVSPAVDNLINTGEPHQLWLQVA